MKMQKKQFRIGELARILGVERFVLRFWEKEFNLSPHRSEGGQRFYEDKDLERFCAIKQLLYEEGFTIAGAKKQLKGKNIRIIASQKTTLEQQPARPNKQDETLSKDVVQKIKFLRKQLISLQKLL